MFSVLLNNCFPKQNTTSQTCLISPGKDMLRCYLGEGFGVGWQLVLESLARPVLVNTWEEERGLDLLYIKKIYWHCIKLHLLFGLQKPHDRYRKGWNIWQSLVDNSCPFPHTTVKTTGALGGFNHKATT